MTRTRSFRNEMPCLALILLVCSTLVGPADTGASTRRGTSAATLEVDGFDGDVSKLRTFSFERLSKESIGVRFTPRAEQLPFTVTVVTALLPRFDNGRGFQPGEAIGLVILTDTDGTGDVTKAVVVDRETTVVNAEGSYTLANPVTVRQGDIYAFMLDLTTDDEGTTFAYFPTDEGATDSHRSYIQDSSVLGDLGVVGQAIDATGHLTPNPHDTAPLEVVLGGGTPSGNLVIRLQGTTGADENVTGGGQTVDDSIAAPTPTAVQIGDDVRLSWAAIAAPAFPNAANVNEEEPNNTPANAQEIPPNSRVTGSAKSTDTGSLGGFCDGAGANCDDVEDWYRFTLTEPSRVSIVLSGFGAANDFDLILYKQGDSTANARETGIDTSGAGRGFDERLAVAVLQPGTYLVAVSAFDPGVAMTTEYKLAVASAPAVVAYNVYCGTGAVTPSATSFVGQAGFEATSLTVKRSAAGSVYVVTAVVGSRQSGPSDQVSGAPCEGGPVVSGATLKLKKNGKLTLTGSGFVDGTVVVINGAQTRAGKVKNGGRALAVKGPLANGQPFSSVAASGSTVTIGVLAPGGGCSTFSTTAP